MLSCDFYNLPSTADDAGACAITDTVNCEVYKASIAASRVVYGRLSDGIAGSNPADSMDVLLLCVVQVAASGKSRSLVQRSPTGCVCVCVCVIMCDLETSAVRRPRVNFVSCATETNIYIYIASLTFRNRASYI
jgi:hypothetical protein